MATTSADGPVAEFATLFARASRKAPFDPTAATLATADRDGRPSARTVLLKGFDERGFVFYTNYESRKARELAENPHAALCFYWPWIDQQARIEGTVEVTSAEEADAYFASRPRGSQLGAWASPQSRPLASRFALLRRVVALEAHHLGAAIPRPSFWGGYRIVPERVEFWQARASRLHERRSWSRGEGGWSWERLAP